MTVRVVTPPAYEPVSLAEAKAWCQIPDYVTDQDDEIRVVIAAARRHAENLTGRAFMPRTLQLILDRWTTVCDDNGCWVTGIELPHPPLREVTSVTYIDQNGVQQTLAADQYVVQDWREPARLVPAWQITWPAYRGLADAVRVNYRAGYDADGSPFDYDALPASLRLWVRARISTFYENREQLIAGNVVEIPRTFADALLDELVVASRVIPG